MTRSQTTLSVLALVTMIPLASGAAQGSTTPTRICLAPPEVEGNTGNAAAATAAVKETFTSFLTGPTLAVSPLSARLQSQVREEAKAAGCQFLLMTTVKHVHKTGGGLLNRMAGAAAQQGVYAAGSTVGAAAGGVAGNVAASAVSGAANAAASGFAGSVRNKDELTLSYRLESNGAPVADKTEKKSAGADGEDLLTPLVRKASEAVAEAVFKKRG